MNLCVFTYAIVAELAHQVLLLVLAYVDHIVAGVNAIPVVIEGHLTRFSRNISALQVLKESLACAERVK